MWFLNTSYLETIQFVKRRSLIQQGERFFCRVFKIHNIFLHYFIGFLTSINYMDKWVTPLGRVFKIHNVFMHGFDKKVIS